MGPPPSSAKASGPLLASRTLKPARSSIRRQAARTASSSSTRRTVSPVLEISLECHLRGL